MKKTFTLFLAAAMLGGCSSSRDSQTTGTQKNAGASNAQTLLLIKKFKPIIQGYWIRKDYVDKVKQTKSPLSAQEFTEAAEVEINTNKIEGDSLICATGDNHDGSYAMIKFIPGTKRSSIQFNGQDLKYSIKRKDTTLSLAFYDDQKKGIVFYTYIRAYRLPAKDFADNLEEYLANMLVAGDYTLLGSDKSDEKVHFDKNGNVTGFLDVDSYFINYDLNSDVNDNLDGIYFKGPNKEQRNFTFKISSDTLKLYDTRENADSTQLLIGDLKYQLIRQH